MKNKVSLLAGAASGVLLAAATAVSAHAQDTVVSGRMYYNLSSINAQSNGVDSTANGYGFDIKRFYVGVDHKFNDMFSGNVTTDFNYVSNDSETQVYIKKAYLQAKFNDALTVRLGSADLPWVPFVENIYGNRYIENVMIDRTKFGTSADWGVHASGSFADGMVSYAVAVVDGAGYKKPLRSNSMDFEGRISAKFNDITVAVGGYTGKLGNDYVGTTTYHTAQRFDALVAYTGPMFRVGAEYFTASDWSNVKTVASDSADGYSIFGSVQVNPMTQVFARYDSVNPSKDLNPALSEEYYNVGVSYSPYKNVDFAVVYKHDNADNGTISTSNGTIGGSVSGDYDEFGVWGQFRW